MIKPFVTGYLPFTEEVLVCRSFFTWTLSLGSEDGNTVSKKVFRCDSRPTIGTWEGGVLDRPGFPPEVFLGPLGPGSVSDTSIDCTEKTLRVRGRGFVDRDGGPNSGPLR